MSSKPYERHLCMRVFQSRETGRLWMHLFDQEDGTTVIDEFDCFTRDIDPLRAWDLAARKIADYVSALSGVEVQLPLRV